MTRRTTWRMAGQTAGREWCERVLIAVAWRLPRSLVYWCVIRAFAHATTGPWSDQEVGTVGGFDILERWHGRRAEGEERA